MSPSAPLGEHSVSVVRRPLLVGLVGALCIGAAIGGAFAGCRPTGALLVDRLETAVFAGAFALLVSRSARGTWLILGVIGVLLARSWLLVPAFGTLLIAFGATWFRRSIPVVGAVVGALGVQVLLRWPSHYFYGFPSVVAGFVILVCLVFAWGGFNPRLRRRLSWGLGGLAALAVVLSIPLVVALLAVRGNVTQGERAARAAIAGIGTGRSSSVTSDLRTAVADTAHASRIVGAWYTAGARFVPLVAQQGRFVTGVLLAAKSASTVGLANAPAVDYHKLAYHNGRINLGRLSAMAVPMQRVDDALHETGAELSNLHSGWLLQPLASRGDSLAREVASSTHSADVAVLAARSLPGMLGGQGVRHYFVAFMSPSESRGYDGFVGSWGLLTADGGHLSLTESGQASDLEAFLPPGGATLRGVNGFLARYGQFHPGEFFRDATYSPDLPTIAKVLSQEFVQTGGVPVDGVLALDPYGLAAFLHFTGPIQVPGLPVALTYENAAEVLLKEQYTTFDVGETNEDLLRHDFLQASLRLAFDKLVAGNLPAPSSLAAILDPAVVQGRISFWSFHRNDQSLLRTLGLNGAFPTVGNQDLLAVTTQNDDQNKIDAFLHKSISDHIGFNPSTGAIASTVTVRLTNDAPAAGLPPIVIATPGYPSLEPGTNRIWLTLYSPLTFDKVTLDGQPQALSAGKELGVNADSAYLNIPPNSTVILVMHLVGQLARGTRLRVQVRLQPSANPQANEVDVVPTVGWRVAVRRNEAHWRLNQAMRQSRWFYFVRT